MFKWLRALGFLITGRFKKAYQALMENEYVMEATFDNSIEATADRIRKMQDATAGLIRIKEGKVVEANAKNEQFKTLMKAKQGALDMAKARAAKLTSQGKTPEEVKADAEYLRCFNGYTLADTDAKKLESAIQFLEKDIEERNNFINQKKLDLTNAKKRYDDLKNEKHEAIADLLSAKEEEEFAKMQAGLSEDTTDKDLAAVREARTNAKLRAKGYSELAGTDHKTNVDDFVQAANKASSASEFDSLIGLESKPSQENSLKAAKLPEV